MQATSSTQNYRKASSVLIEMKERYEKKLAHLLAQRDGLETAIIKAQAHLNATIEALAAISEP